MEVYEAIKKRRAIRRYLEVPPPWDLVSKVIDAGRLAPSSGNLQDWKFIVVRDELKRKAIAEACLQQWWMQTAPVHIVICAEPKKNERFYGLRGERLYSVQNSAAAAMSMLLMAESLGLATCWVGAFEEDMLKSVLGIPDDVRPQAVITLGYADEIVPEPPKYKIENVTFFENWGNRRLDTSLFPLEKHVPKFEKAAEEITKKGENLIVKLREKLKKKK